MSLRMTLFLILIHALSVSADDTNVIEIVLGGARKVRVSILEKPEHYDISVQMIGVRCFDGATNNRLNREKARNYALSALSRHLHLEKSIPASGVTFGDSHVDGQVYGLVVIVPKHGMKSQEPSERKSRTEKKTSPNAVSDSSDSSIALDDDLASTTQIVLKGLFETLPQKPTRTSDELAFFRGIVELEDQALLQFSILRREILDEQERSQEGKAKVLSDLERTEQHFLGFLKSYADLSGNQMTNGQKK